MPLRAKRGAEGISDPVEDEIAELEARKGTLYREIRDAEADRESGKLPEADFERLDAELRGDAVKVLKRLDRLRERAEPGSQKPLD